METNKFSKVDQISLQRAIQKYRLEIIPLKDTPATQIDSLQAAYEMWKKIWTQTLKELEGLDHLPSDDFSRQDFVGAIFQDNLCLAITLYRTVDLGSRIYKDDSYFKLWPDYAIEKLTRDSKKVLICSYLAVDPNFRSRKLGYSLKDLMVAINSLYLTHSSASVFAGVTRNNKGMNSTCEELGANIVAHGLNLHGVEVDLVAFYKNEIINLKSPYSAACETLWRQRIALESQNSSDSAHLNKAA